MESAGRSGEFLPPEPPGPEPDLAAAPAAEPPRPEQERQPPQSQPSQPQQVPPQPQQVPPLPQQVPPQPQQGWYHQPPPQQGWQGPAPGWQPPPWGYAPVSSEPDNGSAVAGFVTSLAAAALLVMTFGIMSAITTFAAPFGIYYSRKGKQAVAEGKTRKHAGLAQAGFVIGIVTLVLSLLAVIGWIVVIIVAANDATDEPGGGRGFSTSAVLSLVVRLVA